MSIIIRQVHPSDLPDLYRICLVTGADGSDATSLYKLPEVLGQFYAAPYAFHEPEYCFVATVNGIPEGYILSCSDSEKFASQTRVTWWPIVAQRYTGLDKESLYPADLRMIENCTKGYLAPTTNILQDYPAHLHIDLTPVIQGKGYGTKLMNTLLSKLKANGVKGIHLGVSETNTKGVAFYEKYGFKLLQKEEWGRFYGIKL